MPKVDVNGLMKKFQRAARIKFDASDMIEFANIVRTERQKAFDESRAPDGSKWKELDPKTIAQKKKEHSSMRVQRNKQGISGLGMSKSRRKSATPDKPLMDTGVLSKPTVSAKTNEATVTMPRSRADSVWNGMGIGEIHNKGTDKIPKREHWAIYPEAVKGIDKLKEEIFERKIREIFG